MTSRGLLAQAATLLVLAITLQLTSGYSFIGNRITDLEGDGASFIEDSTHWIMNGASPSGSNPIHSVCGSTYLLGGEGITNKEVVFKKNYTDLPPHDVIYFSFYASLIDEWHVNTSFALIFDKQSFSIGLFGLDYSTSFTGFSCGNSADKDLDRVKLYGKTKHTGDSLTFTVQTMTHTDPTKRAFGFREVTLLFRNHTREERYLPKEAEMCALASIPLRFNECECLESEYKSPIDGSCQSCDSQCQSCLGPSPLQCMECKSSAFFNGTQCMACHSSCATCFGSAANQCLSCPSNYFMFEGNSCVDSCNAPLVSTTVGSVNYCSFPCPADEFLYSDGSCAHACPATYNSITWSSRKFCSFYCPIGQYYVPPSGVVSGGCLNSCPSGFFTEPTARYCSSCQDALCDVCVDNGATCQKCKPGAILDSDGVCKPCTSMSVSYYKTLDSGYRYMFELYPAACALSAFTVQSDLMGFVDSNDQFPPYHFRVSPQDTNPYLVDLILDGSVLEKKNINLQLRHLNGTMVVPKKLIASETLQEVALYTSSVETVVSSAVAVSFAAAVALGSTAAIWSIISFQQFIGYFAFINVAFPLQVEMFFSLLGSSTWDFLPNPLQAISQPFYDSLVRSGEFNDPENQPPHKFVENDMTSAFIENGGGILVTNIALLGLLLVVGFVKRIERLKKNQILRAVKNALRWNVIARTYLENCIPLLLAVFLQLRSLSFEHLYMVFGSTLSFFALIYCVTIFVLLSKVLYKSSTSELKKEATQKKFGTLSEGIALEGPSSKYYHMIILVRGILLAFLVVFLEDMPVVQIVPLIIYNAYLVYYLFKEANFEDHNLNMINRAKEILILVAETLILGLNFQGGSEQHYDTLGWLIVGCFATALLVELVYMMWLQIKGLPEIKKKIVVLWNLIRNWFKNREARQRQRDRRNRTRRVSPQKCEEDTVMMELDLKEKVEMSAFYTEKSFNLK